MSKVLSIPPDFQKIAFAALLLVKGTLSNESEALRILAAQYAEDLDSQLDVMSALRIFYETTLRGGKIVVCGIGKSYKIATKTVATLKSLSISADELHPAEALHGDLGLLHDRDCLLFFSASGNTPELLQLLPHLPPTVPIVLLSCTRGSKLALCPQVKCVLCAELPEHLKESTIHGIPAPTVSTTLSLALGDAVVIALAEMIERDHLKRKKTFSMKHPGGSIGSDLSHLNDNYARMDLTSSTCSQSLTNHDSYTSLLSLSQVRASLRAFSPDDPSDLMSSLASSDSEESGQPRVDLALSAKLARAPASLCARFDKATILQWSELDLLKNLTVYDYVMFEDASRCYAIESSKIRQVYKLTNSVSKGWDGTDEIVKAFVHVAI